MNVIEDFFQRKSKINGDLINGLSDKVLSEFLSKVDTPIIFKGYDDPNNKLINLRYQYIYTSKYVDCFFETLAKYDYNMKHEIRGCYV